MDTTPSGIQSARQTGHRKNKCREPVRWTIFFALVVAAIGPGSGIVAAQDADVEYSIMATLTPKSLMLDAVALDERLVAVGDRGHILISSDGGASWRQIDVPTRAMLTGVTFVSNDVGLAVGHDSVILRTTDGGESWDRVHWAPEDEAPLFDVWFADANNGVAIGAYGSHHRTTDGGLTWDFEPIGDTDWHLHEIARADDERLYMAAEAGMAYRSDDGGTTWIELPSPYQGSFFGVLPLEDDVVLLFGLRGHLFRSEDAGQSWTTLETGTVAMLTDGTRLPDGRIVITGLGGTLLLSEDGGRSFELQEQSSRRGIQAAVMASDDSLLLVGEFGVRILPVNELERKGSVAP